MMLTQRTQQWFVVLLMTAACGLLMAEPAFAQAMGTAGRFSCRAGRAVGTLYEIGTSCPKTLQFSNIFSFIVCHMEQLSGDLLGSMYCGMMNALMPAIQSVMVLSVTFFGASFLIGVVPMAAREFQLYLLKIAVIYAFMTQSDLLIGFGYKFLVVGMREAVSAALSTINLNTAVANITTGADVYKQLDSFLGTVIKYATQNVGKPEDADFCENAIFAVIALMSIAFPPMAYLSLLIFVKISLTFMRAVFGYIYALVGIAFLMVLAPFFLSFYLFRTTRPLFDRWIGYMAGFALQIVILFAFLGFILSINVSSITSSFSGLAMRNTVAVETEGFRIPWDYCTVCEFDVIDKVTNQPITDTSKGFISNGKLVCKLDSNNKKIPHSLSSSISPTAVGKTGTPAGGGAAATPSTPSVLSSLDKENQKKTINNLFKFTTVGLLSLLVLAYIVDTLLKSAAMFAQQIAGSATGARYAAQLGGGFGQASVVDIPGFKESQSQNRQQRRQEQGLFSNMGDDFDDSFQGSDKNALSRTGDALKDAKAGMFGGEDSAGQTRQSSFNNTVLGWFRDPNDLDEN